MNPQDLYGKTIVRIEQEEHRREQDNICRIWFSDGSFLKLKSRRGPEEEYQDFVIGEFEPSQKG